MEKRSILQRSLDLLGRYADRSDIKPQKGSIGLGLILLMVLASMFKTELMLVELTVKIPLLIMVALLFIGHTYYTRSANKLQRKKMKGEEWRVKVTILVLSLTSVSAHVFVKYVGLPVDLIQCWVGVWIVIGGEALNEILNGIDNEGGNRRNTGPKSGSDTETEGDNPTNAGPMRRKGPPVLQDAL